METRPAAVAAVIEDRMRDKGLTQEALANGAGIPLTTLNRSLRGHRALDTSELFRIADVLGVRASTLTREAESRSAA